MAGSIWTTKTRTDGEGKVYLSCADTAKLVRKALKAAFPGTKFSVRSDNYSMGASINVSWEDGPTGRQVDGVIGVFAGADFDGSIDLKCHYDHWLLPDDTVQVAYGQGTQGSLGYLPAVMTDPPSPNARLVSLGADFVQTHRRLSASVEERIREEISEFTGEPYPANEHSVLLPVKTYYDRDTDTVTLVHCDWDETYASNLVWQIGCMRNYS